MNASNGLAKKRHAERAAVIRSRQFHVVGQFVGRYPLQNQLASISVFAFITLQGHVQQAKTNEPDKEKNEQQNEPRPKTDQRA